MKSIFRARSYYNTIKAMASSVFGEVVIQDRWGEDFEDTLNTVRGSLPFICADKKTLKEYTETFNKYTEDYRVLAERFFFFFLRNRKLHFEPQHTILLREQQQQL